MRRDRRGRLFGGYSILATLADRRASGAVEVLDLTAPLPAETPGIDLPPQFARTVTFELEELSRYDERGPARYVDDFRKQHTGTHVGAPDHRVTGGPRGRRRGAGRPPGRTRGAVRSHRGHRC